MAGMAFLEGGQDTEELIKPFLEALRALYLYD